MMKVGYVVLYVNDVQSSLQFWIDKFGMIEKGKKEAGPFTIPRIGFPDQDFSFELVPVALMADNPDGLNLAAPSIAFYLPNLEAAHRDFQEKGITCSEIADHGGTNSFGFSDNENRWFAVLEG
jgi:lactoylglutathione lyase